MLPSASPAGRPLVPVATPAATFTQRNPTMPMSAGEYRAKRYTVAVLDDWLYLYRPGSPTHRQPFVGVRWGSIPDRWEGVNDPDIEKRLQTIRKECLCHDGKAPCRYCGPRIEDF